MPISLAAKLLFFILTHEAIHISGTSGTNVDLQLTVFPLTRIRLIHKLSTGFSPKKKTILIYKTQAH